jgi:hypothetical protein
MGKKMLDTVDEQGGIWHFWGHSWQVEEKNEWNILEELMAYASSKKNFQFLTNGDMVNTLQSTHRQSL